MKLVFAFFLASSFLLAGGLNIYKQKKIINTLCEICDFLTLVKTELIYRMSDLNVLCEKGKTGGFKYIKFNDGAIELTEKSFPEINEKFSEFINNLGTTDCVTQQLMCDEYKNYFTEFLEKKKLKIDEKVRTNTALSLFGALTVLIFFL
ncbi:MAG: hypothetical protein ACI4IF_04960 [Acutalibacteraceae bacterium]